MGKASSYIKSGPKIEKSEGTSQAGLIIVGPLIIWGLKCMALQGDQPLSRWV